MNHAVGPRGLVRASRRLGLVGLVLIVMTIAAAGLTVWDLRTDAIENYQGDIANLGVVIAEQTARSLQAVDLVVLETREKILASGRETPEQFKLLMASQDTHHFLVERLKNLPQADAIAVVGADGRVANFSRFWPIPLIDVADREYFTHLRDH